MPRKGCLVALCSRTTMAKAPSGYCGAAQGGIYLSSRVGGGAPEEAGGSGAKPRAGMATRWQQGPRAQVSCPAAPRWHLSLPPQQEQPLDSVHVSGFSEFVRSRELLFK